MWNLSLTRSLPSLSPVTFPLSPTFFAVWGAKAFILSTYRDPVGLRLSSSDVNQYSFFLLAAFLSSSANPWSPSFILYSFVTFLLNVGIFFSLLRYVFTFENSSGSSSCFFLGVISSDTMFVNVLCPAGVNDSVAGS
jgi:hypothetical protein